MTFFYEVKTDLKAEEMRILARAGVTHLQPGIEALATSTLKLMKKGTSSFQNLGFLKNCLRYGIDPMWNLLIGFPGEEEDVYKTYLENIPNIVHLPPPAGVFPVRFDRYSPYFVNAEEYGLDLSPYDFYRLIYPFDEAALKNMAYYFEDRNYEAEYIDRTARWQTQLSEATKRWNEHFKGKSQGLRPELVLVERAGVKVVRDTRSGRLVEHEFSPLGSKILELLEARALKAVNVARILKVSEAAVAAELDRLRSQDLLFDENERTLSLVMAQPQHDTALLAPGAAVSQVSATATSGQPN